MSCAMFVVLHAVAPGCGLHKSVRAECYVGRSRALHICATRLHGMVMMSASNPEECKDHAVGVICWCEL